MPEMFLKMSQLKRIKLDGIKLPVVGRESGRGLVPNCTVLRAQVVKEWLVSSNWTVAVYKNVRSETAKLRGLKNV